MCFKKILIFFFMALACVPLYASNKSMTYLGLDYKIRHMPGKNQPAYDTRKVLRRDYPGAVFYVRHIFDNDIGLSLGFEQSKILRKNYSFIANELFVGPLARAGDSVAISTRIQALHFDLNGTYGFNSKFEAIGQLGFALLRAKMQANLFAFGVNTDMQVSRNYRLIPEFACGLQYMLHPKLGIRVLVNLEATRNIRMRFRDYDGVARNIKPFARSTGYSLGLVGKL